MSNVLVVSGHPELASSVANRTILEELGKLLPEAEIDRLDTLYPDFKVDVAAEQAKLVAADTVILQLPIMWYSFPALMHKWMEDTFAHGFSHGRTGHALAGKKLVASFTAGAPASVYEPGGVIAEEELLAPIKATCALTGMVFAGHVFTPGVSYLSGTDEAARAEIAKKAREHAEKVAKLVSKL